MTRTAIISVLALLVQFHPSVGQMAHGPELSDEAEISILTVLPGDQLYSAWGHTGVRVSDRALGIDHVYNYGTFDFESPNFYLNFIRGRLDYLLATDPSGPVITHYHGERRPIIEQTLNLTRDQKNTVFQFLEWNALPENRAYRYDFFFDNCSTRPRDVIEIGLGGPMTLDEAAAQAVTYRQLINPYTADRPLISFGINLLLGLPTDRVASGREEVFLPIGLFEALEHATAEIDGAVQPLVATTDTLFWFEGADTVPAALPWPEILFWALFTIAVFSTVIAWRAGLRMLPGLAVLDAVVFGLVGLMGALISFMWFGTDHTVTYNNFNLLWAWPTHLVAAVFLLSRSRPAVLPYYLMLTCGGTALFLLAWPFIPQALPGAAIPLLLLVILRSGWLSYAFWQSRKLAVKT